MVVPVLWTAQPQVTNLPANTSNRESNSTCSNSHLVVVILAVVVSSRLITEETTGLSARYTYVQVGVPVGLTY